MSWLLSKTTLKPPWRYYYLSPEDVMKVVVHATWEDSAKSGAEQMHPNMKAIKAIPLGNDPDCDEWLVTIIPNLPEETEVTREVSVLAANEFDAQGKAHRLNPGWRAILCDPVSFDETGVEDPIWRVTMSPKTEDEFREVLPDVGPSAPTVTNDKGGKQSYTGRRMDLMPPKALLAVAEVLHHGATKYGIDNWRSIPVESHLNHAAIHIYAYLAGDRSDDHLGHAACRLLMAKELS